MFIPIPGFIISLLTFPGVIVHEFAHRFFRDVAKVPVYKVCYFRLGNLAGFVIHEPVKKLRSAPPISIGPLIINTFLCALLTFSAILPIFILKEQKYSGIFLILLWIGISIGMHAFPSDEDMKSFAETVKDTKGLGILLILAIFFSILLRIANALRVVWFDAIYAIAVSLLLPWLIGVF